MSQSREESKRASQSSERKSGRAVFDEDGRTVWEWQTATGVFERHVSEEQLARLEAAGLKLVEPDHYDTGRFIYGVDHARQVRKQVYVARPARSARLAAAEPVRVFRQLWRRLLPST